MSESVSLPYTALSDEARRFLRRKQLFRLIDPELLNYVANRRDLYPGPGLDNEPLALKHKERTLYLVKGELKGTCFYKIGLTFKKNPLTRDPRVYKEVVRALSVPTEHAVAHESYCLWRCLHTDKRSPYDDAIFGGWAGQGEVINSTDEVVVKIFDDSFKSLQNAISRYGYEQVLLELMALNVLVRAIYDELYLYSGHAIAAYAYLIERQYGCNSAEVDGENVAVSLSPVEKKFLVRRLVSSLAPIVDRKWDELGIRDPRIRYEVAKEKIAAQRASKWGNRDTTAWGLYRASFRAYASDEEYSIRNRQYLVDFDLNHSKIFGQ